jgi:hypothetical protein
MPKYRVTALVKNHWWNTWEFADTASSTTVSTSTEEAVRGTKAFWAEQGSPYFKLLSATKVGD